MIIELEDDIQFEAIIMTVDQKKAGGGSILEILLKLLAKRKWTLLSTFSRTIQGP